jgi:hypothetical protein
VKPKDREIDFAHLIQLKQTRLDKGIKVNNIPFRCVLKFKTHGRRK